MPFPRVAGWVAGPPCKVGTDSVGVGVSSEFPLDSRVLSILHFAGYGVRATTCSARYFRGEIFASHPCRKVRDKNGAPLSVR
jgi:hypothetical protein